MTSFVGKQKPEYCVQNKCVLASWSTHLLVVPGLSDDTRARACVCGEGRGSSWGDLHMHRGSSTADTCMQLRHSIQNHVLIFIPGENIFIKSLQPTNWLNICKFLLATNMTLYNILRLQFTPDLSYWHYHHIPTPQTYQESVQYSYRPTLLQ